MNYKALPLKTILLGITLSLTILSYGRVASMPSSPTLPFIPQDRAEDDNDHGTGITTGGLIAANEVLCGPGVPQTITNISEPTGEVDGFIVFQWQEKTLLGEWTNIPGANDLMYEPGSIESTTTYRRGCRVSSDQPWIYSNVITKKVVPKIVNVQLSSVPVTCKGGSDGEVHAAVAGGTPGYMFDWTVSDETGNELTDIPAGFYNVVVTDYYGCTFTSEYIEVSEPEIGIGLTEPFTFEPTCAGGTNGLIFVEAFDGVAPYTYDWSNGGNSPSNLDLSAGTYHVTVTDALGCSVSKNDIVLQEPKMIKLLNQSVPTSCFDSLDGSVTLSAAGGTAPYYYQWPDGEYAGTRSGLAAGTYHIEIYDNNGCNTSDEILIVQPELLEVSPYVVNNKTCKASVNVLPLGGTPPYNFEWEDGSTDPIKTNLCPGIYTVEVTDVRGCRTQETLEIKKEVPEEDITIKVIVNPIHLEGHIIIKLPFNDLADIRIYSPTGQLVEEFYHEEAEPNQEIKLALDIDRYSNGTYIVEVLSGGLSTSEKVIIAN